MIMMSDRNIFTVMLSFNPFINHCNTSRMNIYHSSNVLQLAENCVKYYNKHSVLKLWHIYYQTTIHTYFHWQLSFKYVASFADVKMRKNTNREHFKTHWEDKHRGNPVQSAPVTVMFVSLSDNVASEATVRITFWNVLPWGSQKTFSLTSSRRVCQENAIIQLDLSPFHLTQPCAHAPRDGGAGSRLSEQRPWWFISWISPVPLPPQLVYST